MLTMTQFLPPNLLALFAPRDPIPYLPPVSKLPHEKKNGGYLGVGAFLKFFEVNFGHETLFPGFRGQFFMFFWTFCREFDDFFKDKCQNF